jgi:uncharacterized protein (DUF2267 family)
VKRGLGIQENVEQKLPKMGSEVRFRDGISAGKVRALNPDGFVVVRGRKRPRRQVFPYSSIATVGNRMVTLLEAKSSVTQKGGLAIPPNDCLSKKRFLREVDQRLSFDNLDRAERVARITLYLTSLRLSDEQKKRFRKALPMGIRSLWATVEQTSGEQSFTMSDFLLPIRKQGNFQSMEEAYIAAREVFASVKTMIPSIGMMDLCQSLPRGIQEIWEVA